MNRVRDIVNCKSTHELNKKGQDIGVAVLDTGICAHPDLKDRIIMFQDFVHGKISMYDDCGHGTHVSGISSGNGMAANGQYTGIAPECNLISLKVLDHRGNGNIGDVLKGIEWLVQNKEKYNIRVVNISVGMNPQKGEEYKSKRLIEGVEYAWENGLVVVTAAGNNGPKSQTITIPGVSKKVITVGSSDDQQITDMYGRKKSNYSSRGPTTSCVCKPDIVAPGSNIISCSNTYLKRGSKPYCVKSGTSMATPVVTGAIALLLSEYPDMNNFEVKMRLRESANDLNLPKNQQGWGELDIEKLLTYK